LFSPEYPSRRHSIAALALKFLAARLQEEWISPISGWTKYEFLRNECAYIREPAMDWSDLAFFLALARSGSLSAAAKRMGTDHSTVARRIESLERDLGIRLVDRLPRAYQLTSAGERVRDLGGAAETAIADIERYARAADRSPHGVVRISGPPHLIGSVIAPSLTSLKRSNPELRIELAGELGVVSLSRREADIALRMFRPSQKGLVARRLAVMHYGLYGTREYVARTAASDRNYIGFDESQEHVPEQRWIAAVAGARPFALRTNDMAAMLAVVRGGLGLAVLAHAMARHYPALVQVKTPEPPPKRELWLLFYRDLGKSPAMRAVIDHIVKVASAAFDSEPDGRTGTAAR
jgi:DNA-binding transcriptional LysR family regulator